MNDNSHISVVLASDDNYFRGLLVTAVSIADHCSIPDQLMFYVLDGGITGSNWDFLSSLLRCKHAHAQRVYIDQKVFSQFSSFHGTGKMAYARLMLPEILPEVHHVIYSDVDILWLDDISVLWQQRDDDLALQYVRVTDRRNSSAYAAEDEWLRKHGLVIDPNCYFGSGMIIMNLEKFRSLSLHQKILAILSENGGDAPLADQTAFNVLFSKIDEKGELSDRWQRRSSDPENFRNGSNAVLHYCGDCPWKPLKATNHLLSDFHLLWHMIYAKIVGISLWRSLRHDNSSLMIIAGRLLYLLVCHCKMFRAVLSMYLELRKKDSSFVYKMFRMPIACRQLVK